MRTDGWSWSGHQGLREYWTRQWRQLSPKVNPKNFSTEGDTVTVDVHQIMHAIDGILLLDHIVKHIFTLRDGLIERFDIGQG